MDGALNRLYEKIARIAGERRWAKTDQPYTILRGLERSIDGPFFSDYCLIAGLQCKYLNNGRLSAQGADKIAHAVSFGVAESEAKRDELTACLDGTKPPIRPRNMGWGRYEFDRLMYLIALESPIEVGVTLMGGTMTYNRIRLAGDNRDNSNVGGEWVTRQFLTLDEARSYKLIEENESTQGRDVVIAGIRGLPRVLEIDNALIRRVRQSYLESMGTEVCVQMYTIQHSSHTANSVYHDDYTDEPIMIVTLLKANGGGRDIRRHWKESNRGTTGELKIGSITLQTFMEIKDIFMRPGPTTGRIFDIDSKEMARANDMGLIIKELGSNYERIEFLCCSAKQKDRWFALLKNNQGDDKRFESNELSIRERDFPKLKDRPEAHMRGRDTGNLEPIDGAPANVPGGRIGNSQIVIHRVPQQQGSTKDPRGIGGYGIPPDPRYYDKRGANVVPLKKKGASESRSRSRSTEQEDKARTKVKASDLRGLHSSQLYNLLDSPRAAITKIDQVSPMIGFNNSLKKEEEGKPDLKKRYGLNSSRGGKDEEY